MGEPPSIDGSIEEWGGTLTSVDNGVAMDVLPTDSLLYVSLSIQNPDLIRSVAENGLIVWVDPTGSQRHTYGIQYPLGLRSQGSGAEASVESDEGGASGQSVLDRMSLAELDVIRNDTVRQRIPARFSSGLRAEVALETGSMIYELAIPTGPAGAGEHHGLRAALNRTVGVGVQTPESDDDPDRTGQATGVPPVTQPGGGRGGVPGGRSPGRGAPGRQQPGGRQGQQPPPEPTPTRPTLDLWTTVSPE